MQRLRLGFSGQLAAATRLYPKYNGDQEAKKSEKSEEKTKISYKTQHDGRTESRIQEWQSSTCVNFNGNITNIT